MKSSGEFETHAKLLVVVVAVNLVSSKVRLQPNLDHKIHLQL